MNIFKKKIIYISLFIILFLSIIVFTNPISAKYTSISEITNILLLGKYKVSYFNNGGSIQDGDKFSTYISKKGLVLPGDKDIERVGYGFAGWYSNTNYEGEKIVEIPSGTKGDLKFYAAWNISRNPFKVISNGKPGLPVGWDLVIGKDDNGNDNIVNLSPEGEIIIDQSSVVSLRARYVDKPNISEWKINIDDMIVQREYHSGEQYIYYDFKMPGRSVIAQHTKEKKELYIDLSLSSIIFDENVSNGSITKNGFWYGERLSEMTPWLYDKNKGYFYIWDMTKPLNITSNNVMTENQIIVINDTNINLKNCKMVARKEYSRDAIDRKLGKLVMDTNSNTWLRTTEKDSWRNYGNIIIDNNHHQQYKLNINIIGDNTIGSIFTSQFRETQFDIMTLSIYSSDMSNLYLGSIFGNIDIYFDKLNINEYNSDKTVSDKYKDNSEYLVWIGCKDSTRPTSTMKNCNINIRSKRLYTSYGYLVFSNTKGTVGSLRAAYFINMGSNSDINVLNQVYVYFYGVSMSKSKLRVGGSFRVNGYSTNGSSLNDSTIIVEGNIYDAGDLKLANNSTVICNTLVLKYDISISNSRIITNQLINTPYSSPSFNKETGYYLPNTQNKTYVVDIANKNDDDLEFITYSNNNSAFTNFRFNSGNIYLFGYYEKNNNLFSDNFNTRSINNPMNEIIEYIDTNRYNEITNEFLVNKIKNYKTNNQSIILGNSSYKHRKMHIKDGNLYSSGNITLFNDIDVINGTVYTNGNFTTKQNLNITNGNIYANEVGNSYNLSKKYNNSSMWMETNISGGNITTNLVGSSSKKINNKDNRSSLTIGPNANFISRNSDKIKIVEDIYINYIYNNKKFKFNTNVNSLKFENNITNGNNKNIIPLNLVNPSVTNSYSFDKPISIEDNLQQKWKYNSINGDIINTIDINGYLNSDTKFDKLYYLKNLNLFAVKDSYNLYIDNNKYDIFNNNEKIVFNNSIAKVNTDSIIKIKLNNSDEVNKTVVWYYDDSNVLHNVLDSSSYDYVNNTITFKMPSADTSIFITNEIVLDIFKHDISISNNGFSVALKDSNGNRRSDSIFNYSGSYLIKQSNIDKINVSFKHGTTPYWNLINTFGKSTTNKRIVIEKDFVQGSRTIGLTKIKQVLTDEVSYGILVEDFVDVSFDVLGPVQLYSVKFFKSTVEFNGKDNTKDALYVETSHSRNLRVVGGNEIVEAKFNNLWLFNAMGYYVYSNTKGTSKATFTNCLIDYRTYAYNALGYNMQEINYINCDILLENGKELVSDTCSTLFNLVDNINFIDTKINYFSGGGRGYSYLFSTVKNIVFGGNSIFNYNYRNSEENSRAREHLYNLGNKAKVTLKDNAKFIVDHRIRLYELELNDNSEFIVEHLGEVEKDILKETYLLCGNITVNGGKLIADNIILSGFYNGYNANTWSDVLKKIKLNSEILDGKNNKGFVLNNGTVNATNFIGGDINSSININGGVLNTNKLGTIGKLYGYGSELPIVGDDYVGSYDKYPNKGTIININGGFVNISKDGYLGGINSKVNVNTGNINLDSNSTLGINATDTTNYINHLNTLGVVPNNIIEASIVNSCIEGDLSIINIPYSTLDISGLESAIKVKNIRVDNGTINIRETNNNKYTNPYIDNINNNTVGIIILDNLITKNLNVTNNAILYINNLFIKSNDNKGTLKVDDLSIIYTNLFGTLLKDNSLININNIVMKERSYPIFYNLNDTYNDKAENPNYLMYIAGKDYILKDPVRYGFIFDGWYHNNKKISVIDKSLKENIYLEARWIPLQVKFKISIDCNVVGIDINKFKDEVDLNKGTLVNNIFTYNDVVSINYLENIIDTKNIQLNNYNLVNYIASSIRIKNKDLNPDNMDLYVTEANVSREILEYYSKNNIPIELEISGYIPVTK